MLIHKILNVSSFYVENQPILKFYAENFHVFVFKISNRIYRIDTSNIKYNIRYNSDFFVKSIQQSHENQLLDIELRTSTPIGRYTLNKNNPYQPDTVFPLYIHLEEGETETPETPTETIIFPPRETHLEFMERIQARLLHLTRRVAVLRHEQPHLSSRSRRVCLDLDDRNEYVHRYDHSINLVRLPVGWLQNMINAYQAQWNAHLERVEDAKKKSQSEPEFTRYNDRDPIETLLEKLETTLTEEALIEHHEVHDTTEWQNAHAARKIVLCNEDCSVGEEIADINSYHTSNGITNHRLAEKSFHDVAVTYWNQALQTPHRKLVTERTVEI